MGDPQITAPPGRTRGAMLRAYDKKTGQEVGAVWMPAIFLAVSALKSCAPP
jgi:quinoprotein glucose dehydrogenase